MLVSKPEIPFVSILLPFSAGIVAFYNQTDPWLMVLTGYSATVLFLSLVVINIFYKRLKAYRFKGITGLFFAMMLFLLGGWCCLLNKQCIAPFYFAGKHPQYLKIRVDDEPQLKNGILRFTSKVVRSFKFISNDTIVAGEAVTGKLMVAIKIDSLNPVTLNYGDELIIPASLTEIASPYNPAEFDYRSWLAAQNIYHQVFLKQTRLVILNRRRGNKIIAFALQLRASQVAYYRKLLINDDAFAIASTLILGYRADLDQDILSTYSKTGTIHMLSVSGMHVGIIYLVLNWMLQFLNGRRYLKIIKIVLILVLIWFYTLLTGLSPSVLRSAIMLSVFITAKSFARNTNSYNIIAFAAFCLLLYNPFLIWDVGFQLSFLAVTGLVWLQPKIQQCWYFENSMLNKLWGLVAMSIAAQLITFPFSIYYFHQFPVYFLVSNLFIMLPSALLMYLGIIILLGRLDFLAPLFEWLINSTNSGLKWIADLPFSSIQGIWISKAELIVLCAALLFLILSFSAFKKTLLLVSLVCVAVFQSLIGYDKIEAAGQKKIIIFNISKKHAAAFITGNKAVVFTDLKPGSKTFKYFVQPALEQHKIKEISYVTGNNDTTLKKLGLKEGTAHFYNYRITKDQLLHYNLKRNKARIICID